MTHSVPHDATRRSGEVRVCVVLVCSLHCGPSYQVWHLSSPSAPNFQVPMFPLLLVAETRSVTLSGSVVIFLALCVGETMFECREFVRQRIVITLMSSSGLLFYSYISGRISMTSVSRDVFRVARGDRVLRVVSMENGSRM